MQLIASWFKAIFLRISVWWTHQELKRLTKERQFMTSARELNRLQFNSRERYITESIHELDSEIRELRSRLP